MSKDSPDILQPSDDASVMEIAQNLDYNMKKKYILSQMGIVVTPIILLGLAIFIPYIMDIPEVMIGGSHFTTYFIISLLVTALVMVIEGYFRYQKMDKDLLTPLHELILTADSITKGNTNNIIESAPDSDLRYISQALASMQYHLNDTVEWANNNEKRKKILYSGIAHDLRSPLTSIIGYTEALQRGLATTEEKRKKYVDAIAFEAGILTHLVNQLLIYNKLSNRTISYPMQLTDLASVVESFVSKGKANLADKKVHVTLHLKHGIPVMANAEEIQRIITNFLTNTVKYRIRPESEVVLTVRAEGNMAVLSYHDDGPGVEEDKIERIFEPFYRSDAARSKTSNGSGLGLAVVSEIVSIHKGHIEAKNDNGLLINIYLPIVQGGK